MMGMLKPKALIAGDSISFGYGPLVANELAGQFDIRNLPENGGTSANLLAHLEEWFIEPCFDIIQINCGLHDLALSRETRTHRVPLTEYVANLSKMVPRLKETPSRLVWASTTPVIFSRHRANKPFDRREGDVILYNREAAKIMVGHGLPINDLHDVVEGVGRERCVGGDGVHMTDVGNRVLAGAVSECLKALS